MQTRELTWAAFCQIRHGDVILTGDRVARLVLTGPADRDDHYGPPVDPTRPTSKAYVQFPIHARSWTNRASTLVNFYDLAQGGYAKPEPSRWYRPASARALCVVERETLARLGFDWVRELRRELDERARQLKWMRANGGHQLPDDWGPAIEWLTRFVRRAERWGRWANRRNTKR